MVKKILFVTIAFFFYINRGFAQDKIYFESEVKDGKIVEITQDKIKFRILLNPGPLYAVSKNKVLFAFNNAGDFIVPAKLDSGDRTSRERIRTFLQSPQAPSIPLDRIITTTSVINCDVGSEDETSVHFKVNNAESKIDKSSVIAIIYRSGQHKLLTDPARAVAVLGNLPPQSVTSPPSIASNPMTTASAKPLSPPTPAPDMASAGAQGSTAAPIASTSGKRSTSTVILTKNEYVDELGEVTVADYERKALQKTKDLSDYLKILCDKSTDWQESNKAIDLAVALFTGEDATVEVSNVNTESKSRYKIREYLKRIKLIKYQKVEVEWTNVQYVSNLRKGEDGFYYGVITFQQVFRGYMENRVVYSDITKKNVTVVLKTFKKSAEGKTKLAWDVLLEDIGVVVTKF
jgi:hypothetical protein